MRKFILYSLLVCMFISIASITTILVCNKIVVNSAKSKIFTDITTIQHRQVGLLLGTSKTLASGTINLYFTYRVQGAAKLYHAKKINKILISGDHGYSNYNEPLDMQKALVELGVPKEDIILDYAGFRTLDSIYRAKKVFGQNKLTIISQEFHNQRAIYIANYLAMDVIAYNVDDVSKAYGYKTMYREKLARVKVVLDKILNKKPKFLGKKIII